MLKFSIIEYHFSRSHTLAKRNQFLMGSRITPKIDKNLSIFKIPKIDILWISTLNTHFWLLKHSFKGKKTRENRLWHLYCMKTLSRSRIEGLLKKSFRVSGNSWNRTLSFKNGFKATHNILLYAMHKYVLFTQ